jgi:hypothetical protein
MRRIQVAYRHPGKKWKSRIVREAQLQRLVDRLRDEGAEVFCREAEVQ